MDVAFDQTSSYVFIADYSGQINVLKLDTQGCQFITTLKGHQSKCICNDVLYKYVHAYTMIMYMYVNVCWDLEDVYRGVSLIQTHTHTWDKNLIFRC